MKIFLSCAVLMAAAFSSQAKITGTGNYFHLPENLAYFTATRVKNNVGLKWETVNEQSSKGFAVLRKTSGEWEQIAFVPTNSPDGNSSALVTYEFNDVNAFKGISQYQVVEVSENGKRKGSEVRAVKGEGQTAKITIYPNPSNNGRISIVFENNAAKDIFMSDMMGRLVKRFSNVTDTNITVDNLPAGFYTIRITDRLSNETAVEKVIVNK